MEQVQIEAAMLFESWGHVHTKKDLCITGNFKCQNYYSFPSLSPHSPKGMPCLRFIVGMEQAEFANFIPAM